MMTPLWIALAGGLGTLCRYALGRAFEHHTWPLATFGANILGSLAIGVLAAFFATRPEIDHRFRLVVVTGFLGGFTTYSAFAYESVELLLQNKLGSAALYVAATLGLSLSACALAIWGTRWFLDSVM